MITSCFKEDVFNINNYRCPFESDFVSHISSKGFDEIQGSQEANDIIRALRILDAAKN